MKRFGIYLMCAFALLVLQCAVAGAQKKDSEPTSLYERLGGSETLGKIFDDVGPRMATDPLLAQFFLKQSPEALARQRQATIDFLCRLAGGPCEYKGPSLQQAHGPLHISEEQWRAFVKHLAETLDFLKIADKEKRDMLALVAREKSNIVAKK